MTAVLPAITVAVSVITLCHATEVTALPPDVTASAVAVAATGGWADALDAARNKITLAARKGYFNKGGCMIV